MKDFFISVYSWIKSHSSMFKVIFFGSILVFVVNQVTHIFNGMSWSEVFAVMHQQSNTSLFLMSLVGFVGLLPTVGYDYVTIRILEKAGREKMPRKDWFVSAWIINTINNLAGFGGVVGASLRSNFYGKGVDKKGVLAVVSKVALFMLSGLSLLALVTLVDIFLFRTSSIYQEYWIWLLVGSLLAPVLGLFAYLYRKRLFQDFFPRGIIGLYLSSLGQWLGALTVFLMIGKMMNSELILTSVYPMFIIATLIGMLTMVPGGMGTFDVLIILGLTQLGLNQSGVIVWLLYYRLFYYVIPFLTGILLFVHQAGMKINRFFDNLPRIFSQKTAHFILVTAVYSSGVLMVLLSTVTNLSNLSQLFEFLLPFSFDFLDQTVNLLVGFLLLGLARALWLKVKSAFWPTMFLLGFCIVNTILRTQSIRLIVFYLFILLLVWVSRNEFYREKLVYSWGAVFFDGLLFGLLFIGYAIAGYYNDKGLNSTVISNRFILFPADDVWFSGLIGIGISLIALVTLYQYLSFTKETLGSELDLPRLQYLINTYGGSNASHYLTISSYQYFYYRENREDLVVFGYQIKANKCFVLGNPIGKREKWKMATQTFMKEADNLGYQLAFYKITDEFILILHDLGYDFTKVGEAGIVQLQKSGQPQFTERIEFKKLYNEGYRYFYYAKLPPELLEDCWRISDEWLKGAKEKHFSVGHFEKSYLFSSGVGVTINSTGEVVSFITQQPVDREMVSFDLLRIKENLPPMLTNYLIANQLDEYQRQGFLKADIGMAPLAKVGDSEFSFWEERIMNLIYQYGDLFYDFQTIVQSKEFFVDSWQPRYFAYRKNSSFILAAVQLLLLIGKGKSKGATLADEMIKEL